MELIEYGRRLHACVLQQGFRPASFECSREVVYGMLDETYGYKATSDVDGEHLYFAGMKIKIDPALPVGTILIADEHGRELARIENLTAGADQSAPASRTRSSHGSR